MFPLLLQELLLARKGVFLLFYGDRLLCSCGRDLDSLEDAENHLVKAHERCSEEERLFPKDVVTSKFIKFAKDSLRPDDRAVREFLLPENSHFSVCPDKELLPTNVKDLKCEDCDDVEPDSFESLREHYKAVHQVWLPEESPRFSSTYKKTSLDSRYFCPLPICKYHLRKGNKYFTTWKLLCQHYRKVHAERTFECNICRVSFPVESDLNQHVRQSCLKMYNCGECGVEYRRYENLQTHCRRKGHSLDPSYAAELKIKPKSGPQSFGHLNAAIALTQLSCDPNPPKNRRSLQVPIADVAVQTNISRKSKRFLRPKRSANEGSIKRRKCSKNVETTNNTPLQTTSTTSPIPTQAIQDLIETSCADTQTLDHESFIRELFSSSETQTCWEKDEKDDLDVLLSSTASKKDMPKLGDIEQFSTETQTDALDKWRNMETQFSVYDTLSYFDGDELLRSIETQTYDERMFSNTETQT